MLLQRLSGSRTALNAVAFRCQPTLNMLERYTISSTASQLVFRKCSPLFRLVTF